MKVLVQRPLEARAAVWNGHVDWVVDVELRSLGKGWHVVEALRPLGPEGEANPDGRPLPILHKGYFDSHLHVGWMGLMEIDLDLRRMSRLEEVFKALREREASGAAVVRAYGWDEARFGMTKEAFVEQVGAKLPSAIPVILYRVCGHSALVGRVLLERAGLPTSTSLVGDRELVILAPHIPMPTTEEYRRAFLIGQRRILDDGISGVGDMSLHDAHIDAIRAAAMTGELRMDVMGVFEAGRAPSVERTGPFAVENTAPVGPLDRAAVFSVQHWKKYLDGSFGSRTAWLSRDYADVAIRGDSLHALPKLLEESRAALREGFYLSFHAIGDAALDQILEVGERLRELMRSRAEHVDRGLPVTRHRIEHAQLIRDDQLDRLARQGFWSLCVQPNHRLADEPFSMARLGADRLRNEAYRLGALQARGLSLALSSDAPVDAPNPERVVRAACTHENARERVTFADALWLLTTGARLNLGLDPGRIGIGSTVRLTDPAILE